MYEIPYVKRSEYIKVDRYKLSKLNFVDKLNCAYCGYANGWLSYATEIAAKTESYWCAIKHKSDRNFKQPAHHIKFKKYFEFE